MRHVVVVGAGMAGARLAEELRAGEPDPDRLRVTLLGQEPEAPYNRIMLSHAVAGGPTSAARLKPERWWEGHHIALRTSTDVVAIDRAARRVELGSGEGVDYDHLILATGAAPRIPPVTGIRDDDGGLGPGVFTLRDSADCRGLTTHLADSSGPVALIGGGFIGLEVACALASAGHDVVVVHSRAWPMTDYMDSGAGAVLIRALEGLGVRVMTGVRATGWDGRRLRLGDEELDCGTVLLTAGMAPRVQLAVDAGLEVGHGVVVDDHLLTSDPRISAIGDCAEHRGVVGGLVAPAWDQAVTVAARLTGSDPEARYVGGTRITRLKAFGLDVVSLGTVTPDPYDARVEVTMTCEPALGRYARVDVADGRVVGAALVGHPEPVGLLTQLYENALPVPDDVLSVILGRAVAAAVESPSTMPASAVVCRCNGVRKSDLVQAWSDGARDRVDLTRRTRAGTGCGGCSSAVDGLHDWLQETG